MKRLCLPLRPMILVFLITFVIGTFHSVTASDEFFPLERVEPGMRGYARTVVQGTNIETFDVEVLGVLPDAVSSGDLILIRASGEVIERTGGIASGMSGSPVYLQDKLVGAIGYGFAMADHTIGLVTPIQDMYKVLERIPESERRFPEGKQKPLVLNIDEITVGTTVARGIAIAPDYETAAAWAEELGDHVLVAAPARTPLMVSGLSARSLQRLKESLANYDVFPVQAGGAPPDVGSVQFEPGSGIGVQLARGDVNITGIGTVTHVDDAGFLAFGHPFFNMGSVDFIATTAYIHHTVNSLDFPFKLGAPLEPVGRILQDRGAAIAGTLASYADTLPIQINVFDRDANRRQSFRVDVVRSEELLTAIAGVVSLEALDRALDRLGSGTSRVIMQIAGDGLPKRIVRDNMYYSHSDIAATSLIEFLIGLEAVVSNEFEKVRLTNIRLDVEVEEERWTARIVQAVPQQREVYPGESVDVEVTLRPFRGPVETKVIRLDIPHDVHPGEVSVAVRSGGFGYFRVPSDYVPTGVEEPVEEEGEGYEEVPPSAYTSLEGLLDLFMNREKNNEVVVEFFPYYYFGEYETNGGDGNDFSYYGRTGFSRPVQASLTTRYVIQGSDTFTLRILSPEQSDAAAEEDVAAEHAAEDSQAPAEPADELPADLPEPL